MATEIDFVPFAAAAGANVLTQAEYLALAALGPGFSSGEAYSAQVNKVLRQASIMAAVLANVISDVTGQNAIDDGTTTDLIANLAKAILMGGGLGVDSGAVNAYIVTLPIAPLSLQAGMVLRFAAANANTGASTINVNGLGAVALVGQAGLPLQGGEVAAGESAAIYNGTEFVLLWSAGGKKQTAAATGSNQAVSLGQLQNAGSPLPINVPAASVPTNPVNLSQFVSSFSGSGYVKLPGGLIIQWSSVNLSSGATTTLYWPIAYPTAAFFAITGVNGSAGGSSTAGSVSTSGCIVYNGSQGSANIFVLSIGY